MALDTGILSTGAILLGRLRPAPINCPKRQVFIKHRGCVCIKDGKEPIDGFCSDERKDDDSTSTYGN